ncbi:DUF4954 family protein [Ochrovirga pacifica]|uniref:DUF4954 family protein n=1 Tax=Ochrovirga pacifica TaxID=1042376 RepID=UPI0002557B54|nr:DUF4954 family protein [Ochrovirga pacifica]
MKNYISVSQKDIEQLQSQGCSSDDWSLLYIKKSTDLSKVKRVTFSGKNYLGSIEGSRTFYGGIEKKNVIEKVHLHNCSIGDNPYISNVRSYIANYNIGENVLIYNVGIIAVDGVSTFGNGIKVDVINEGGGREIPIFNKLSAQIAYFLALYRHKTELVTAILKMVDEYTQSIASDTGTIGDNVKILNTDTIKDVAIGDNAVIRSVSLLKNGSINSRNDARVYIGTDVKVINFIISSDSFIDNASFLSDCFIGQGCRIDKQYAIDHSVFFANSQGFNGEACSIFAGPYTVTHHKSTLLIAGLFSFMNAGSGSNQSNHMYKLGPIHQGIMSRGAKTTSNSYVLWPSKIGAFTLIMGRHYKHVDSSDFPFSYLIENDNKSYLIPGANLKSVGVVRDMQKWPKRDKRSKEGRLDIVNFNAISPYTISKVAIGLEHLNRILENSDKDSVQYTFRDMVIKKSSLIKGIRLYTRILQKYLGGVVISKILGIHIRSEKKLREILKPTSTIGNEKWVDIAGMICPKSALENVITKVQNHEIDSIEKIHEGLQEIHENYDSYLWGWTVNMLYEFYMIDVQSITKDDLIFIVDQWREAVVELNNLLYKDASKEFDLHKHIGFGADGDEDDRLADFINVRGEFEKNSTVVEILNDSELMEKLGTKIITQIKGIKRCVEL